MGAWNTSAKVFIIVWGLTEHKGNLVPMIIKQYLLTTKPWWQRSDLIHSKVLGRVSWRTGENLMAQDGVGYAESHTQWFWNNAKSFFWKKIVTTLSFHHSLVNKESACNAGDLGLISGSGRSSGERNGNPLQYSCLDNPMDRGAWQATAYRVTRGGHDLATKQPRVITLIHYFLPY